MEREFELLMAEMEKVTFQRLIDLLLKVKEMSNVEKDLYRPGFVDQMEALKGELLEFGQVMPPRLKDMFRRLYREMGVPFTLGDF